MAPGLEPRAHFCAAAAHISSVFMKTALTRLHVFCLGRGRVLF